MAKTRVFISFDYDNDRELKEGLVGQSRLADSPFSIANWSLQEAAPQLQWEREAESRLRQSDLMIVILGYNTHQAPGVLKEVGMAVRNRVRVLQLKPQNRNCRPVANAGPVIDWTWENLKRQLS